MKHFYIFQNFFLWLAFVCCLATTLYGQDVAVTPSQLYARVDFGDDSMTATRAITLTNNGSEEIDYFIDKMFSDPAYHYRTGFENYELGNIDTQHGWFAPYYDEFKIDSIHPYRGKKHMRALASGSGDIAQIYIGDYSDNRGPVITVSMNIDPEPGVSWYIRPEAEESRNGTIIFDPAGNIIVEYFSGVAHAPRLYDTLSVTIPEGYFNIAMEIDKRSGNFKIFMDNNEVFEGRAFIAEVEYITFLSGKESAGPTLDVDNLMVYHAEFIPEYLTLSSYHGTLPAGESLDIQVNFDGNMLDYGVWHQDLLVYAHTPINYITRVQTTFRVVGPVVNPLTLESLCSDNPDSVRRWRIYNPNDFEVNAEWTIAGSEESGSLTAMPGDSILFTNTVADTTNAMTLTWLNELFEMQEVTATSDFSPCSIQDINLTSLCYDYPDLYRKWRVRNPNPFGVMVAWEVVDTNQFDSLWASPGDTFFYTQAISGPNTTKIKWVDTDGVSYEVVKASSGEACDTDNSCVGGEVVEFNQGLRKKGTIIPLRRSNPENALGMPQENTDYNFVSLGFGGSLTLKLNNHLLDLPGDDFILYETSYMDFEDPCETYPEMADVYVSDNGEDFHLVGTACKDTPFDISVSGLYVVQYIRIVDVSDISYKRFGPAADAFDVDGIMCTHETPAMARISGLELQNTVPDEDMEGEIVIYPNPFRENVSLVMMVQPARAYEVVIHNLNGEVVYQGTFQSSFDEVKADINTERWSKGAYTIIITSEDGSFRQSDLLMKQ